MKNQNQEETGFGLFILYVVIVFAMFTIGFVSGVAYDTAQQKVTKIEYAKYDSLLTEIDTYKDTLSAQLDRIKQAYSPQVVGWYLYPINKYDKVIGMPLYVKRN